MLKHHNDGFFLRTHSFSLHKTLIDGLDSCGLLWCFYQRFGLSFWRIAVFTPLVSKWCNAKLLQICSDEEINSSTSWMAWGWVIIHLDKEKYILIKNITQQLKICYISLTLNVKTVWVFDMDCRIKRFVDDLKNILIQSYSGTVVNATFKSNNKKQISLLK